MLSERNSRAEHYDEDDVDKTDPWRLENLLPDEQVSLAITVDVKSLGF